MEILIISFTLLIAVKILEEILKKPKKNYKQYFRSYDKKIFENTGNFSNIQKENIEKGKKYEIQIAKYMVKKGYEVIQHGILKGKKDKGIDIIAYHKIKQEYILIQCKNWEKSKIEQKHIKEFIGNCTLFLSKNSKLDLANIRKIFVTSYPKIDYGVKKLLEENKNEIEYKIIPYERY